MSNMRQIARLAGVSLATVSRALRKDPSVTAETRENVADIARKLNYTPPNQPGVHSTEKRIIGYLVHNNFSVLSTDILRGAMDEARQFEMGMLVMQVSQSPDWIEEVIHSLLDMQIDGLALAFALSTVDLLPRRILFTLRSRGIHVVQIMRKYFSEPLDSVYRGEREYASVSAEHLAALGHRRVFGLGLVSQELWKEQFHARDIELSIFYPASGAEMMQQCYASFLQMTPRPTACIISRDDDAFRFAMLARLHGLAVPDDLSILGMGNFGVFLYPDISTIDIQPQEMGRVGIKMLTERIVAGIPPHEITDFHELVLQAQVIDRGSTGPAPQ